MRISPLGPGRIILAILCTLLLATNALGLQDKIKRGKWRKKDVPKGWTLLHTRHYQVQSGIPEETARVIADHLEDMMKFYRSLVPTKKKLKQFILKILPDRQAYLDYGASEGSVAYYSERSRELVCYFTGNMGGKISPEAVASEKAKKKYYDTFAKLFGGDPPDDLTEKMRHITNMDLLGVLSHEGWHQYFHFFIVSKVQFPAWLDEGLGDYFYTVKPGKNNEFKRGDIMPQRFMIISNAILRGEHVAVKDLIRYRQPDYYKRASLCYSEGWSLVHFVFHGGHPEYKNIIKKLIERFKDCHDMDEATSVAFRNINIAKFERDWRAFYEAMDPGEVLFEEKTEELKKRVKKREPSEDEGDE